MDIWPGLHVLLSLILLATKLVDYTICTLQCYKVISDSEEFGLELQDVCAPNQCAIVGPVMTVAIGYLCIHLL